MKAMQAGWVGIALLGVAGPVALTHCSGSDSGTSSPDGGEMSSGSSSGSGASGATSGQGSGSSSGTSVGTGSGSGSPGSGAGSGTSSTGPVGEGGSGAGSGASSGTGVTSPGPDGGAPSDPGMVACGSTSCNTSQTSCCQTTGDAGTSECVPPNGACTGTTLHCNEASDCASGLVCCDFFGSTSCAASCGLGGFQMCRMDSECGTNSDAGAAAQRCILQTCGGTPTGRGGPPTPVTTVEACAVEAPPTRGGPPFRVDAGAAAPGTWGPLTGCTAK